MKLRFKTFSMAVVVGGAGHVEIPSFSEDEKLNKFKINKDNAYYIMPEQEISFINDGETQDNLVVFIANCDI
jgi:hypothetical protein